jgi:hypothetical protein
MKSGIIHLFFYVATLALPAASARAEDVLNVIWRRVETHPDGKRVPVLPPKAYLDQLKACGVTVTNQPRQYFPVSKLRCPGLLDFSRAEKYRGLVRPVLDNLLKHKINRIAGADIAQIRARLDQLEIAVSPWGVFEAAVKMAQDETPRHAAINIAGFVILNQPLWQYIGAEFRDLLVLHEVLGAAGFGDQHYELTLTAWWLARHPERIPDYRKQLAATDDLLQLAAERESTSVVGHGGDFAQIQLKASLLEATLRKLEVVGGDNKPIPARFLPTQLEQEQAILKAMMMTMPEKQMMGMGLCLNLGTGGPDPLHCGHFLPKGITGVPVIAMSREWATRPSSDHRWPMLLKIYTLMQQSLICDKGFKASCLER